MKICSKCNLTQSEDSFYVKNSATGRLHAQCKACYKLHRQSYAEEHYQKYKLQYRDRAKKQRLMLRLEYRVNILAYLKDKACVLCGESDVRTFEFDHLDPSKKLFSISQAVRLGYRWPAVENEIQKCRILCANCHKKHTASQAGWYKDIKLDHGGTYRI